MQFNVVPRRAGHSIAEPSIASHRSAAPSHATQRSAWPGRALPDTAMLSIATTRKSGASWTCGEPRRAFLRKRFEFLGASAGGSCISRRVRMSNGKIEMILIAARRVFYDGRTYNPGEQFRATKEHAGLLTTLRFAFYPPIEPITPDPPEQKSKRQYRRRDKTTDNSGPKRKYRRRDMQAEDYVESIASDNGMKETTS